MRDPRILLGCANALVVILAFAGRRLRERTAPSIGGFDSARALFGDRVPCLLRAVGEGLAIYRYLAIQESLSGVLMLAALRIAFGPRGKPLLLSGLFALAAVWTVRTTQYPWWDRAQRGPEAISVQLPPLEPDAMVFLLDSQPYAYLVPSMPISARAIGVNNNLVHPGASGRLWSMIEAAVRDHRGPLWGVEDPADDPGVADVSLSRLRLARDSECFPLITNTEAAQRIKICKLRRAP